MTFDKRGMGMVFPSMAVFMPLVKLLDALTAFWQNEHWDGFFWVLLCIVNLEKQIKSFWHKSHCSVFSTVFIFLFAINFKSSNKNQIFNQWKFLSKVCVQNTIIIWQIIIRLEAGLMNKNLNLYVRNEASLIN